MYVAGWHSISGLTSWFFSMVLVSRFGTHVCDYNILETTASHWLKVREWWIGRLNYWHLVQCALLLHSFSPCISDFNTHSGENTMTMRYCACWWKYWVHHFVTIITVYVFNQVIDLCTFPNNIWCANAFRVKAGFCCMTYYFRTRKPFVSMAAIAILYAS